MADSAGVDRRTGKPAEDWDHVQQSIAVILTTPIGSRVMRRDFGSELFDLVDAKMTARTILAIYGAAATAIARWEPRFRLARAGISRATAGGQIELQLFGVYYPRGHLGDFSVAEDASARIVLGAAA